MTLAMVAVALAVIALPHALRLEHAPPGVAVSLWLAALTARALTAVFAAVWLMLFLPATQLFDAVSHWCWHTVVPLLATHLGLSGHRIADLATLIPLLALAVSGVWVAYGIVRAARSVRRLLSARVGTGPRGSVIVGGPAVVLAAAGIRRPQVVVSAGALTRLDDAELAAGLDHERGHIERRHRYLLVVSELCAGLARFLPGSRRAATELSYHLERDADAWALSRRHDPFALASAICKAAVGGSEPTLALSSLGGSGRVGDRVRALISPPDVSRRAIGRLKGLAILSAIACLALAVALPASVAVAGPVRDSASVEHCTK